MPLIHGHAHNDYEHKRPLLDALEYGMCSIEADIWLVGGELLVAHDRDKVKPGRTLQSLYLDPLRERVKKNGGRVYKDGPEITLLIDFKSPAAEIYPVVRDVLQRYAEMLTEFRGETVKKRAVTVILTGNSSRALLAKEKARYAASDGTLEDLDSDVPVSLVPLISDAWTDHFRWFGVGEFPERERLRLREVVMKAHKKGRRIRFWASPNSVPLWREQRAAGVDLLNVDDLDRAQKFLLAETP